jgi:AcrR family transcriptional regulator
MTVPRRRPTRKRNSGEETRAKLLDAARRTGSDAPLSRITVEKITTAAGVSRATFYLYFESKDDIYLELVQETCDRLYAEASRPPGVVTAREAIVSATRGYAEAVLESEEVLKLLYTAATSDERFGALLATVRERFFERIARNLERGIAEGIYREIAVDATSRALGGMVEYYFVELVRERRMVDVEQSVELLADLWYRAIAADPFEAGGQAPALGHDGLATVRGEP